MVLIPSDIPVRDSLVLKAGELTTLVCGFEHELRTESFPGCANRENNMLCGHGELLQEFFSQVVELVLRNDASHFETLDALQAQQRELSLQLGAEDGRIGSAINDPMGGVFFDQIEPAISQGKRFQAERGHPFRLWQSNVLSLLNSL